MAYEFEALDTTLAAAAGNDAALYEELRGAFLSSFARQIDLLRRARCDGNWQLAALRLKALGASFQSGELIALAEEATDAAPGDPKIVRLLQRFYDGVSAH